VETDRMVEGGGKLEKSVGFARCRSRRPTSDGAGCLAATRMKVSCSSV
jgi:hypothetical protein